MAPLIGFVWITLPQHTDPINPGKVDPTYSEGLNDKTNQGGKWNQ